MNMPKKNEETIFKEIEQFKKVLFRTNLVRAIIIITMIILFSVSLYKGYEAAIEVLLSSPFMLVGFILFILGLIFVVISINRLQRFRKEIEPPKEDKIKYLRYWEAYYKNTLKVLKISFWYFLIPVPGLVLMIIGAQISEPLGLESLAISTVKLVFFIAIIVGFYYLGTSHEIKWIQKKIDGVRDLLIELESRE